MRRFTFRLAAVALAALCCNWELLPPTGYDDAGRLTGTVTDRPVTTTCGALEQACCDASPRCEADLACVSGACFRVVACAGLGAACQQSSNRCCGGRLCRSGVGRPAQCCLELDERCDPGVPNQCCGETRCHDPGTGEPTCACTASGGACVRSDECCQGSCNGSRCS